MNKKIIPLVFILWLAFLLFNPFKGTTIASSGWTLRGKISDSNGRGLSGLEVEAIGPKYYTAHSDKNGNYILTGDLAGTYILQVYAKGYADFIYWNYVLTIGDDKTVNFALRPGGGSIKGHVLNGSGVGVGSAVVKVFEKFGSSDLDGGSFVSTITDSDGYFDTSLSDAMYGGLPSGTAQVSATSNGRSGWNNSVPVTAGQTTSDVVIYILTGTASVSGYVTDLPSNAAINAATVIADNGNGVTVGVSTDSNGYYSISGLPAGSYHLVAHLGNQQTGKSFSNYWNVTLSIGQHKDIDFGLKNGGGWISGRVLDSSGHGISTARVQIWENTGVGPGGTDNGAYTETTADANGNFTTDPVMYGGLPTGSMRVRATNSDKITAWNYSVPVIAGEVTSNVTVIIYSGNGSLTGRITTTTNGNAVSGAEVVVDDGLDQAGGLSDNNGDYSIGELPAGDYNVVVNKAGYAAAHQYNVRVLDGQPTNHLDFSLSSQIGSITGLVKDSSGKPIQNVSILADTLEGTGFGTATTDANGYYALTNLAPMNYIVHAAKSGYAGLLQVVTVQNGVTTPNTDFVLTLASRQISGQITKDGQAAPFAGIYVKSSAGSTAIVYSNAIADKNGRYTVRDLAPGKYDLHVSGVPGYANEVMFAIDVTTTNAANININFIKGTSTIVGHVTDNTGKPLAGVNIEPFLTSSPGTYASLNTDASGYYSVSGMWSGLYNFEINKVGFDPVEKYWIQVNPNETTEVNFVMGLARAIVTRPANVSVTVQNHIGTNVGVIVELTAGKASDWTAYSSAPWLMLGSSGNTYQASGQVGDVLILRFVPDNATQSVSNINIKLVAPGLPDGSVPVTMTIMAKYNKYKTFIPRLTK